MSSEVAVDGQAMRLLPCGDGAANVLECVDSQEKLERLLPRFTWLVVFGLTLAFFMLGNRSGDVVTSAFGAIVAFFIAKLAVRGVKGLVLEPMRRVRFNKAADRLSASLRGQDIAVGPMIWTLGAPGAMAMTRAGEVIILDRAQAYRPLRLRPHQIADVRVECNSRQFIQTLHSGQTTVGRFGKSFGMGYSTGGSSTSVAQTNNEYLLEIRYQLEKNGAVGTVIVPGGPERRVVEELCAAIRRLEA